MKVKQLLGFILVGVLAALAVYVVAAAQNGQAKPYQEGEGARVGGARVSGGLVAEPGDALIGSAGSVRLPAGGVLQAGTLAPEELVVLYRFTGVTDDGEQGSLNRKKATAIICSNLAAGSNQVFVEVFQWNGTDIYTGTVTLSAGETGTFSTQDTGIYTETVILGGSPGTDAIFQGFGVIHADQPQVICTAQALDPLNNPPTFVTQLPLYRD